MQTALQAKQVGQDGIVVAVDPDVARLELAQESHREVKILTFHDGSAENFPGIGSEMYDMVFCNAAFIGSRIKKRLSRTCFAALIQRGKLSFCTLIGYRLCMS